MLYQEIAKLKKAQFGESSSAQIPSAITTQTSSESGTNQSAINGGPEPTSKWVYQALEEDTSFAQSVLYPILNKKLVPNNNQINLMVRILGKKATNIYGFYPTTETKHKIALDIIDQFQQLSQTAKPGGPPESAFFYHNNGKGPGKAHNGKIFKFFGNGAVTLPADKKKFPRSAKTVHNIDDDIIKANEKCAKRAANKDNFEVIRDTMITSHPLLENYLIQKCTIAEVFGTFPHFKAFDGIMIQDAFARLNQDTYDKYNNVKKLFAMGNLTNLTTFDDVEDGALRGCLNIMNRLDFRGIKRKYTEEESIVQTLARPLIRWVKNTDDAVQNALCEYNATHSLTKKYPHAHIICKGDPLKKGDYFIYLANEIVPVKKTADVVLDVFFKIFTVTGLSVPTELRKLHDFIHISAYKVLKSSTSDAVNTLVESFNKTAEAEASDSE